MTKQDLAEAILTTVRTAGAADARLVREQVLASHGGLAEPLVSTTIIDLLHSGQLAFTDDRRLKAGTGQR